MTTTFNPGLSALKRIQAGNQTTAAPKSIKSPLITVSLEEDGDVDLKVLSIPSLMVFKEIKAVVDKLADFSGNSASLKQICLVALKNTPFKKPEDVVRLLTKTCR